MRAIQLNTGTGHCRIITGCRFEDVRELISGNRTVVITDKNVRHFYGMRFPEGIVIEIDPGEKSKNLETVYSIYGQLLSSGIDRSDFILGIGGGVVCDLTGYIASTYMRGLKFGFVATTLLAQVDAAIGGKNGVDYKEYKNIIGIIRQPEFVLCDHDMLKTLDKREFIAGLAEVIKYGAIMDNGLFAYCEDHCTEILGMKPDVIGEIVHSSAVNKVKLVGIDELETGERTKLNFGHTFAHALEKITGIGHGEAVAVGMVIAGNISVREGVINEQKAMRLRSLIMKMGLPVITKTRPDELLEAISKDKKKRGDKIGLVLLEDIGRSVIRYIDLEKLKGIVNDLQLHSI